VSNAGADISICGTNSAQLQAENPFPATGVWSLVSGNAVIADSLNPNTTVTDISSTSAVFRWTVSTGNCPPSFDDVVVSIDVPPSPADAGPDTILCTSTFTLNANVPDVGTGIWSLASGSGVVLDASNASSGITGLTAGNTTLVWTISNGVCASESDSITITISQDPIEPNGGPDLSICSDTAVLSAAVPSVGTGVWAVISGNIVLEDSLSPTSAITVNAPGISILTWTVSNGSCVASDTVEIVRSLPPDSAFAGTDAIVCDSATTLNAIAPIIGSGQWSILSGSGIFSDTGNAQTLITGLAQ
jgi:hypothetical protein